MRKHVSWGVAAAVGATALAATVDSLVADGRPARSEPVRAETVAQARPAPTRPSIPECNESQLAFSIDILDMPAAVLEHVQGDFCRRPDLPLSVSVVPSAGEAEGEIFGPEGMLDGTFSLGEEHVAAFHYRPTCAEQGPFMAVATTGDFVARREIPTDEPCFPPVQRKTVVLGPGSDAAAVRIEALNPGTHTFTVRLALPHAAQVTLLMRDAFGAVIRVRDDETGNRGCRRRGETAVCVYRFPSIETQSPGNWRVSIRKASSEPATVRFQIRFERV